MVTADEHGAVSTAEVPAADARARTLAWAGVVVVVLLLYAPGITGFFAGDAFNWLLTAVRTIHHPSLFFGEQSNFVRHGQSLFFIVNGLASGFRFPVFFLSLLVIHIVNVLLVGRLALRSGAGETGALLAALLWGIDYRHTEAVFRIYVVADPLALMLGLIALLLFIRGRSLAAAACLLAALFCKENALVFPAVALVWVLLFVRPEHRWRRAWETLPMFGAAGLFVPLLVWMRADQPHYLDISWAAVPRFIEVLLSSVGPDATYLEQDVLKTGGPLLPMWLAVLLLAAVAVVVWRMPPRYRFGPLWIAITVVPTLFVPFQSSRYLYAPLVGVALLVGVAATDLLRDARRRRSRWKVRLAVVAYALYLGHAAWGVTVEGRDHQLMGEIHRQAAESFRRDALPAMLRNPGGVTVFVRDDTKVWAGRLLAAYGGRPWYWPTTHKWIYRRPYGVLGMADTYGFVTYCAAVEGGIDPPLFEPVSERELADALAARRVLVISYDSRDNRFGEAPPWVAEELAGRTLTAPMVESLQPGRFSVR